MALDLIEFFSEGGQKICCASHANSHKKNFRGGQEGGHIIYHHRLFPPPLPAKILYPRRSVINPNPPVGRGGGLSESIKHC